MTLVVTLTVRHEGVAQFRAFEHQAAKIMVRYGGGIAHVVAFPQQDGVPFFKEVHIVKFPDPAAFASYCSDPDLEKLRALRDASVVQTEILIGEDGPRYGEDG